jgi:hypothetical protein
MRRLSPPIALVLLSVLAGSALGAEPEPGKTVEIVCKANQSQKYFCYVPKAYDAEKKWPILYCFSPNARGDLFVQRFHKVCERRGWIVVGSMNSQNGPWQPIKEAIAAMWADTEARFNLSKTMRYASGFSGGSRVSFEVAKMHAEHVSGVIGIGAGLPDPNEMPRTDLAVFIACGEGDPNKRELDPLHDKLRKAGNPVIYKNFPGGHVMPEIPLLEEAVEWLDDQAVERKVERFKNGLEKAKELEETEPVKAWVLLGEILAKYPVGKKLTKEAESLRKKLERVPEVKTEATAKKRYDSAIAWVEKNRARIAKSKSVRAQAVKKLRDVSTRYPGTYAAGLAEEELAKLEGE